MFGFGNTTKKQKQKAWSLDVERGAKIKHAHKAEISRRKAEAAQEKRLKRIKQKTAEYKALSHMKRARKTLGGVRRKKQSSVLSRKSRIRII